MVNLSEKQCAACKGGIAPLQGDALETIKKELGEGWNVINEHHLEKEFIFKDFKEALAFTNQVGALAEEQGHHPDIHLAWGKTRIVLWTHKINGLSEGDFILAAKIETLPR